MNDDKDQYGSYLPKDPFLPILLLAISYLVLMVWQVSTSISQRELMQTASTRQEQMVTQSHQAQAALQKLASDVLEAAKTDDTAKAIVQKYGMQQNGPSMPAPQ